MLEYGQWEGLSGQWEGLRWTTAVCIPGQYQSKECVCDTHLAVAVIQQCHHVTVIVSHVAVTLLCPVTLPPPNTCAMSPNLLRSEVVNCLSRDVSVVMIGGERLRDVYNYMVTLLGGGDMSDEVGVVDGSDGH